MSTRNPADPEFPHGDRLGYKNGCRRKTYDCPATPTCSDVHAAHHRKYRKRRKATKAKGGRYTKYVLKRLAETLTVATDLQISERTGLSVVVIDAHARGKHRNCRTVKMPERTAAPLDEAWAWFVHGTDVATLTEHGTDHSYRWGYCRCAPCTAAAAKVRKLTAAGIKSPDGFVVDETLHLHVRALIEAAGTITQLSTITGTRADTIGSIARYAREGRVRVATRDHLRSFTVAEIAGERGDMTMIPVERANWLFGTLRAQGFPAKWVKRRIGMGETYTLGDRITLGKYRMLEALHAQIGDREATPADGITVNSISRMKNQAKREGYYPARFYDADRNIDYRSMPGHPWSKADDRCASVLPMAYEIARGVHTNRTIADMCRTQIKYVERMKARLGIHAPKAGETALADECKPRAAWIRSMIEDYDNGVRGPVEVALTIGARTEYRIPSDHPEIPAYRRNLAEAAWLNAVLLAANPWAYRALHLRDQADHDVAALPVEAAA